MTIFRRISRDNAFEEMIRRDFWNTVRFWTLTIFIIGLFGVACAMAGAGYERIKQRNAEHRTNEQRN